jgi:magnesium transporter
MGIVPPLPSALRRHKLRRTEAHMSTPTPGPRAAGRPSRKIGLSPGTLVHLGRRLADEVRIEVLHCAGEGELARRIIEDVEELAPYPRGDGLTWVDVNGIHDVKLIGRIGEIFGLHPLLLEDVVSAHQRPKFETHDEHLFLVVKMLLHNEETDELEMEQVSVVIGHGFVLTFQERERDTFDPVRRRLADPSTRVRRHGADFLAYALVDTIVDNYFAVLEWLGDRIEDIEDRLIESPHPTTLREVYDLKRSLVELRRVVWPLRDALNAMGRGDAPLIQPDTLPYLRDVQDHTLRVIDTIETYRDMAVTLVEMYMSGASHRLNEVMRVLTVIATIFIPLTFIVGVYGMNFDVMPELHWRWAYPVLWALMIAVPAGMVALFKRRRWI